MFKRSMAIIALTALAVFVPVDAALPEEGDGRRVFLREEFDDLDSWKPLTFPKIKKHSTYSVEEDGENRILRAESDASASGLIYRETFPVYDYSRIRWRWKVGSVYEAGDARTKGGDDYPLRLYVIFPYEPEGAGFGERIKYGAARAIYGEYPPHSALNYIWANRKQEKRIIPNSFTSRAMMIIIRGPDDAGEWQVDETDILKDYRETFGEDPPREASLAIMNDSDNTGESSVSYVDYVEIFK